MQARCVKSAVALFALAALGIAAGPARADQEVTSSDGQWKVSAKLDTALAVRVSSEALVHISPAAGTKGCPSVSSVVFEMPAHGHGGSVDPKIMAMGECEWHVTDLNPSMGGAWRLRLVLKSGAKSSNADFDVAAK